MMKSKIHRATVTDANVDHVGSITLDPHLMEPAEFRAHEQIHVLDIDNGAKLTTYAIPGEPGEVAINGAAAHLASIGDRVIVPTYADTGEAELDGFRPLTVRVDAANRPVSEEIAKVLARGSSTLADEIESALATLEN